MTVAPYLPQSMIHLPRDKLWSHVAISTNCLMLLVGITAVASLTPTFYSETIKVYAQGGVCCCWTSNSGRLHRCGYSLSWVSRYFATHSHLWLSNIISTGKSTKGFNPLSSIRLQRAQLPINQPLGKDSRFSTGSCVPVRIWLSWSGQWRCLSFPVTTQVSPNRHRAFCQTGGIFATLCRRLSPSVEMIELLAVHRGERRFILSKISDYFRRSAWLIPIQKWLECTVKSRVHTVGTYTRRSKHLFEAASIWLQ